jgi:hypothetical protein
MKNFKFLSLVLLFTLISCGKEQFGSTPTSSSGQANGVENHQGLACASSTLVKPPVDILYVVDNSTSTNYITSNIKSAIQNTINSVSQEFDYRIIGVPLISTSMTDFQVLASNPDTISGYSSNKISSSNQFTFFQTTANGSEKGFSRVYNFANYHKNGLLRSGAHTIVVLVSNGLDSEATTKLEHQDIYFINDSTFSTKFGQLNGLKSTLGSIQFRFMSVVAHSSYNNTNPSSGCSVQGSTSSNPENVYKKMSRELWAAAAASDSGTHKDSYDLCNNGFSNLFVGINSSINQVLLKHTYNYWPVTINAPSLNPNSIQVYKQSNNTSTQLIRGTHWDYMENYNGNSRTLPTPGEPISGKAIKFLGEENYVTYPDCVVVKATNYTEYFQYYVLPQAPIASTIVVTVNGTILPSSAWSYAGLVGAPINIKVAFNGTSTCTEGTANCAPATPAVMQSGYMIKFNSPNFYKSGDVVTVHFQAAPI